MQETATVARDPVVVEPLRLSRSLVVGLFVQGVALPEARGHASRALTLPELTAIEHVARGVEHVDDLANALDGAMTRDELTAFVAELHTRELLVDAPDASEHDVVRSTPAPAPEPGASSELPSPGERAVVVPTPRLLRVTADGFEAIDFTGDRQVVLSARELCAAAELANSTTVTRASEAHADHAGPSALSADEVASLTAQLLAAGLAEYVDERDDEAHARSVRLFREAIEQERSLKAAIEASLERVDAEEAERQARTGVARTRIVPVQHNQNLAPLSLGMLFAYAQAYDDGSLTDRYVFYPSWMTRLDRVPSLVAHGPSIYVFSNYHWSHSENMAISDAVKEASPSSITIHGGPDAPKYANDVEIYFERHPSIDVVVHGEGEITFAELLEALSPVAGSDEPVDLSVLDDVAGLSYRGPDGKVHRTGERERVADLDVLPSPYLTGIFAAYGEAIGPGVILESNRGCPYGCTFCDWGSATSSRIRKFDLDRVLGELEWCAQHRVPAIFMADANFGIFERDVAIAEKVAELRRTYGYPKRFITNFAKNTIKHLKPIVELMVEAGIFTEGLLSLQSMDEDTLDTIRRSNIKLEKYEQLAREFRRAKLPLYVDLMLGLPGSTVDSFKADLQQCVDREVTAKIFLTELLVNSPMNDPAYRTEHKIQTSIDDHSFYQSRKSVAGTTNRALLVSTASYTRSDYERMKRIRSAFLLCENYGVLRQVSRHVRQTTGMLEVDLYDHLRQTVVDDRERLPHMALLLEVIPKVMVMPVSWALLLDEVRGHLVNDLGVADDSALDAVFRVQHALLPARGRTFPLTLELAHDVAAWHEAMTEAKDDGHQRDWPEIVPALTSYGPASFTVDDPLGVCNSAIGLAMDLDGYANWELDSPVARRLSQRHLM